MKTYKIEWTKNALIDLNIIFEYIADDSTKNALKTFRKIHTAANNLKKFPKRGRIVPEFKLYGICTYHEIIVQSWRVIYNIYGTNLFILAVLDSRRNIKDILFDRFINKL